MKKIKKLEYFSIISSQKLMKTQQDPMDTLKDKCGLEAHAAHFKEELDRCTERVLGKYVLYQLYHGNILQVYIYIYKLKIKNKFFYPLLKNVSMFKWFLFEHVGREFFIKHVLILNIIIFYSYLYKINIFKINFYLVT